MLSTTKEEVQTGYKEIFFLLEGSQAEKQVVHRDHAGSVLVVLEAQLDEARATQCEITPDPSMSRKLYHSEVLLNLNCPKIIFSPHNKTR